MIRPQSRKVRALEQTRGMSIREIVKADAAEPYTYAEIAAHWHKQVTARYPDLVIEFTRNDVYLIFKSCGVRRRPLYRPRTTNAGVTA